jgi:hypothetical protein
MLSSQNTIARVGLVAAVLSDGRVLIVGGSSDGTNALNTSDIYDPQAGSVTAGPVMSTPRAKATATTLFDGTVVVIGGSNGTTDLHRPPSETVGKWSPTGSIALLQQLTCCGWSELSDPPIAARSKDEVTGLFSRSAQRRFVRPARIALKNAKG